MKYSNLIKHHDPRAKPIDFISYNMNSLNFASAFAAWEGSYLLLLNYSTLIKHHDPRATQIKFI